MVTRPPISIALARFEDLVTRGLRALTSLAIMIPGYTNLRFEAQGRLFIEGERPAALPFQSSEQYDADTQANGDTQARIIKGRDLARRVVRRLHVETYAEFNGNGTTSNFNLKSNKDAVAFLFPPLRRRLTWRTFLDCS